MNAPFPNLPGTSRPSDLRGLLAQMSPFAMIASIVGVDLEVLRKCGHASWSAVFSTFVLVLLSFTWQTVLFSSAAAVMVGGGEFYLSHLALAILLSAILTLSELLVIVGPSWVQHGISSLAQTGRFKAPPSKGSIIRLAFVIGGRFASVMLTANFFAVVACLLAFDQDTRRVIARWHSDANAQIVLEATRALSTYHEAYPAFRK